MTKICLYGPTGSGKTTLASLLVEKHAATLIKIAAPIYELQEHFYSKIEKKISGQDGELMQFLGAKIEKEQPLWLARNFLARVESDSSALIVNDDCRANSYAVVREAGFRFVRILCDEDVREKRKRGDHIAVSSNHVSEMGYEQFSPDFVIDNNGSLMQSYELISKYVGTLSREG